MFSDELRGVGIRHRVVLSGDCRGLRLARPGRRSSRQDRLDYASRELPRRRAAHRPEGRPRRLALKAGFALGSWLAFEKMDNSGMVMGGLVLTMDEVSPVMKKLVEGGIEVTALHNHLLRNQPFTMYMHILGRGDPVKLAAALHSALGESKTPLAAASTPAAAPPPIDLDTAAIDQALGAKGTNNGGVYQFGIPRAEPIKD